MTESKRTTIFHLTDDNIISILSYLRAFDFVNISEVDKTVFSKYRIQTSIKTIIKSGSNGILIEPDYFSPASLYIFEVKKMLAALNSYPPPLGKGFWISSSWILAAKKYYDNVNLPLSQNLKKSSPNKKKPAKSQRKGSEILPPWPIINSEILCDHGGITVSKHPRAKRKTIDSKSWKILRSYYPLGPEFSCCNDIECLLCMETDISLKAQVSEKKELEISTRKVDFVPPKLESLFSRRSGVPSNCLVARVAEFTSFLEDSEDLSPEFIESLTDIGETPLISGLYNIVPRDWLREWRKFVKNPTIDKLPPLDCSSLVCYSHGLLVVPPHFEEYMLGVKKSLLSGLGAYPGEIVEILSAEEWDDLTHAMPGLPDLNVRFCLADGVVIWNTEACTSCDPFNYSRAKAEKKRPNSKHHSYRPEVLVR